MVFSSYSFIFLFLPIVFLVYFGMARFVSRTVQHLFLIVASLYFYAYTNLLYVILILASILANYLTATGVQKWNKPQPRKIVFLLGVLFNVGLLGYYKYKNFFLDNMNSLFDTQFVLTHILLPLGISFFTFQQIAFLISIWKKQERVPSLLDYTLFISFFPQLVAGPIVFSQDVMDQYREDKNRFFDFNNLNKGLFIFMLGLFKKIVIADTLAAFASSGYSTEFSNLSFGGAWITSLAYTLQIFFDFSGYSDMAIGLGKMFNINLPVNFYSPYKSKSITEFWKRWHITLGRSLAVLIYFPLGGNRKGAARTGFNLFMVFLVSGIWHGAAWTFIIWGILHGLVRVFEKIADKKLDVIPSPIRVFFTFLFVNAAWVLFRSPTLEIAISMLKKMFMPTHLSFDGISRLASDGVLTYPKPLQTAYVLLAVFGMLVACLSYKKNSIDLYNEFKPTSTRAIMIAILFCISILHLSKASVFIYFNF